MTDMELNPENEPIQRSNGWRLTAEYPEQRDAEYMCQMVEETLADPRPPKPIIPTHFNGKLIADLSASEKEDFYFSMQLPFTQTAMKAQKERHPSEDREHALRPMADCLAVPHAKTKEELVAERHISIKDFNLAESARRTQKNTRGQSELGSVDPQKRERGIQAFTYSKPVELTDSELKKVTKLEEIKSDLLDPQTPKKSLWKRIKLSFGYEDPVDIKKSGYMFKFGSRSATLVRKDED